MVLKTTKTQVANVDNIVISKLNKIKKISEQFSGYLDELSR